MARTLLVTLVLVVASTAMAYEIDQSQKDGSVYMAAFSQTDLAQSFKQASDNIVGAEILTQAGVGNGDDITIALWNKLPNQGGVMLASGTDFAVKAGEWATVEWPMVSITPEATYYLVFTSKQNTMGIAGSVNNPYPRGQVYANSGYQPFPDFDYAFQTFKVPEPASLLMLGLAALALRRR